MQVRMRIARLTIMPALAALAVACEMQPDPEPADPPPPAEPAPDPAAEPELPDPEMEHVAVELRPVGDSEVEGEALIIEEAGAAVVVVEVAGLPGEGEYPIHIHEGSCAEGGPVSSPLNPVVGEGDGTGTSTTTLERAEIDGERELFVNLHAPEGEAIACGDLDVR